MTRNLIARLGLGLGSVVYAQTGGNLSNCRGGCDRGEKCVGNAFSQPVEDSECNTCAQGRYWWPCNFETLCFCSSVEVGSPRVPPAPKSGFRPNEEILDPCQAGILTEEAFNQIVQPSTEGGRNLYTYDGFCQAIQQFNKYHDEKFAGMGSEINIRADLAAFLAHAATDTYNFSVTREEMHCVDPVAGSDGQTYCKPCKEEHYNFETKTCSQDYFAGEDSFYSDYCDLTRQGAMGCMCDKSVRPVSAVPGHADLTGYMSADDAYFTRGSIDLKWNYDYLGASMSMGDGDYLCENPDLIATSPRHAWGAGLYKYMKKMIFGTQGTSAHKQVMKENFGGSVEVLYGDLECPSNQWTSAKHVTQVKDRVRNICKAGAALGVYLEMDKCDTKKDCLQCEGLREIYDQCIADGSCPECSTWTEFLVSVAPTVTPIRVASPSWDDWAGNIYSSRNSASGDGNTHVLVIASVLMSLRFVNWIAN